MFRSGSFNYHYFYGEICMNNCIIQGKIISIEKVKFCYYDKLKAVLIIYVAIGSNINNVMECRIYDNDIDIFLDKYSLKDICILCGSLRKSKNIFCDYILVKEIY